MIRVRYRDPNELSPGLHAVAERHGRTTTVYLLSGLTKPQRRSALRRLRLSARMGHCPGLPGGRLALALFADRIRTGIGQAGAVLRLHPADSTLPVMVLSGGAIAFLLFSTVSIRVLPTTPASPDAASSPGPAASAGAGAVPFAGSRGGVTGLGGSGNWQAIPPGLGGSSLAAGPAWPGPTLTRPPAAAATVPARAAAGPAAVAAPAAGPAAAGPPSAAARIPRRGRPRAAARAAVQPAAGHPHRVRRRRHRPRRRPPRRRSPRPARRSPRPAGSA